MPRKSDEGRSGQERRGPKRTGPSVSRRTIKRDENNSQLLGRGESPTAEEQVEVDSPRHMTNTAGPRADAPDRFGKTLSPRRTDESLTQEIHDILSNDPELDATDIEVEVEAGAVTIRGAVDGSDARLLAEELVESVTGVREVHNRLRADRGEG